MQSLDVKQHKVDDLVKVLWGKYPLLWLVGRQGS